MRVFLVLTIATTVSVLMGQTVASQAGQLTGTVRDVCGRTLPGTAVHLVNESGTVAQTVVDGEGRYAVGAVRPGPWVVTFALLAFRSQDVHILVSDRRALELNVRLLPDSALKEELTVTHGDPNVHYRKYLVHGVVSTLTGEPIRAATVHFREVGPQTSVAGTDVCTTDEFGRSAVFRWNPAPARWSVSVEAAGYVPHTYRGFELKPDESQALNIRLVPR